ncbi:MAG: PfkB family carbohydrate kinase [bacterium]
MMNRECNKKPVLIVGSIGLDDIETPFGIVKGVLGGAACYSSTAASIFTDVRMIGVVGEDFPTEHIEFFNNRDIDTRGVARIPGETFRWSGYYEYDMNQAHTRSTDLNVLENFNPIIPDVFKDTEYIFLANIHPELQLAVLDQLTAPKFIVADTMNFWLDSCRDKVIEVFKRVNAVTINDAEARQLCNTPSLVKAGRQILELGPEMVVIKKGEHGAVMMTADNYFVAPSFPLEEVKDPTGAGDTFAGGMLGYIARIDDINENNLRKAVIYGSVLASYTVEDFSLNRLAVLEPGEVICRFAEMRRMTFVNE